MTVMLGVFAAAEVFIAVIAAWRLFVGPTVSDRIVALNAMASQATLAVIVYAAFANRAPYADVAIWLASFSYLGTVVWARYLERGLL
ncbi:MAG: monovalent cation/H+ antiporter complex subunit F [Acidimicrobiales bacterium]